MVNNSNNNNNSNNLSQGPSSPRYLVCVTGAAGFIASHLIKQLLEKGYHVRGTVRNLQKKDNYQHLINLPFANERLELLEANLTEEGSFDKAISGCEGVFHTASPFYFKNIKDPQKEMIEPAVFGTLNVLKSCKANPSVKRVIVTSSVAAVMLGDYQENHVFTEADWSDVEFLQQTQQWYLLSKTLSERACWDFYEKEAKDSFTFATINPSMVLGPLLQPSLNTSNELILQLIDGTRKKVANILMNFVDVRDVADSHIKVYENDQATGRFICNSRASSWINVCDTLRECIPNAHFVKKIPTVVTGFSSGDRPNALGFGKLDTQKLKSLGVKFRLLEEMLVDTVQSLEDHHFLPKNIPSSL